MSTIEARQKERIKVRQDEFETAPLSRCIEIALADMKKALKDDVKIDMDMWVHYSTKHKCSVCLAGCVMINTYNVTEEEVGHDGTGDDPSHSLVRFGTRINQHAIRDRLYAINDVRCGYMTGALACFGIQIDYDWQEDVPIFKKNNPDKFLVAMERIAEKLKAKGY